MSQNKIKDRELHMSISFILFSLFIVSTFPFTASSDPKDLEKEKENAIVNFFENQTIRKIEKGNLKETDWNRKVTFVDYKVSYVKVTCDKESGRSLPIGLLIPVFLADQFLEKSICKVELKD